MYKTSKVVFSPRVRKSPYFNSTIKYGAQAYSVYNHMYMPISYEGTIQDYKNLLNSGGAQVQVQTASEKVVVGMDTWIAP